MSYSSEEMQSVYFTALSNMDQIVVVLVKVLVVVVKYLKPYKFVQISFITYEYFISHGYDIIREHS